jgi:hypothetical protein
MSEYLCKPETCDGTGDDPRCPHCTAFNLKSRATPSTDGGREGVDFAEADWFAKSIDEPMKPMLDVEPRLSCEQRQAYNLARAYLALLAERDRLVERLAAQSGWAEDDELARLREDKARLDWLEEASVIPTMFDNLVAPDPCFITREFADGGIRCHRGVGVRGALDAARAAATPEGSDA